MLLHGGASVPDKHPALFEYGHSRLGEMSHRWASEIELLTDDRVIWAYDFDDQWSLYIYAILSNDPAWKKNTHKMAKRLGFFR